MTVHRLILFFLLTFYLPLSAQKPKHPRPLFGLHYGYRLPSQNFYNQLNSVSDFDVGKPLQVFGFTYSSHVLFGRRGTADGHGMYSTIIPKTIRINDSVSSKINGFVFSLALGKSLVTKSGALGIGAYLGVNTGRLRLSGTESLKQKNPFFSPKVGLEPRVLLGKMGISFILEYEYDLSKSGWRKTRFSNGDKLPLNSLRQSGITGLVCIGFKL